LSHRLYVVTKTLDTSETYPYRTGTLLLVVSRFSARHPLLSKLSKRTYIYIHIRNYTIGNNCVILDCWCW